MNGTNINALFLDVGGVLLTNGWDREGRQRAIEKFHLDENEVNERHHLAFDIFEEGKTTLDEYLDSIVFYEPREFSKEDFKRFMYEQSQPYPEMINLFKGLKEKYNLKVFIVNNEGRELNEYRIQTFKLDEFVDGFISSCFVHFRKPDEDIYRIALDIAQIPAEHILFVDDRKMFADVAEKLGMKSIHHEDYASTVQKLTGYGLVI